MGRNARDEEFREFAAAARGPLLRTASMLAAGDSQRAEDLVQIALTKVYVAWPRIREGAGTTAYARKVLVNAFIDETRRPAWRREQAFAEVPDQAVEQSFPEVDPREVESALRRLPPRMRAVVVLRYWLDMDVATTAAHLNCSPGTVRGQASRALAMLRRTLDGPAEIDSMERTWF